MEAVVAPPRGFPFAALDEAAFFTGFLFVLTTNRYRCCAKTVLAVGHSAYFTQVESARMYQTTLNMPHNFLGIFGSENPAKIPSPNRLRGQALAQRLALKMATLAGSAKYRARDGKSCWTPPPRLATFDAGSAGWLMPEDFGRQCT
jgi:hypothetical protein